MESNGCVFAAFYGKFYDTLVMRLKRGFQFSHKDAEDVVQTALTRLWAKNPTFAGIDDVERYVFRCVKSAALDYRAIRILGLLGHLYGDSKHRIGRLISNEARSSINLIFRIRIPQNNR